MDLPRADSHENPDDAFEALQARLPGIWRAKHEVSPGSQTIVIVPSVSLDRVLTKMPGIHHYEERFLILLLLLRHPGNRVIYVTSEPVRPGIADYYLRLLPAGIASQARRRLALVSPLDATLRPLTQKLLERPRLLAHLRMLIGDPRRAYILPFVTTDLERDLAVRLQIPVFGAHPKFLPLGTKSGGRRLFAEEAVPHPLGYENVRSISGAAGCVARMRQEKPDLEEVLVKTNAGASGLGNLALRLSELPPAGASEERPEIERRLREALGSSLDPYNAELADDGGVVEERILGEVRSPSVQFRITPAGEVQMLSTHDQLLGGKDGQTYVGCRFPANPEYALAITTDAEKVARRLAREGVIGRAAVDFVVARSPERTWQRYAIEINLRLGGTTHPFLTLQLLTGGRYLPEEGIFVTPAGGLKFLVANDHVESPLYRRLTPEDLFDLAAQERIHFDHADLTGVVFHMMSALPEFGQTGITAIGHSAAGADAIYRRSLSLIKEKARAVFESRT
ncbi:MAG: peptide ligase PGM1-related protein [Actinomycetota bacterium]